MSAPTTPVDRPAQLSAEPPRSAAAASAQPSPRQPCPCGSGKRYKVCHGRAARAAAPFVLRPFEGLPGEAFWVALRELLPAATALVHVRPDAPGLLADASADPSGDPLPVTIASVLPGAVAGLRRPDGSVLVALQTSVASGDASRDAADAVLRALALPAGEALPPSGLPGPGPRLQDVLVADDLAVTVHDSFAFWAAPDADLGEEAQQALAQADAAVDPVVAVAGVQAAYWTRVAGRELLRWVLPFAEQELLDALGRLGGAGELGVAPGARFLGAFRAQGVLVPVWELADGTGADGLAAPAAAFEARLRTALAASGPLTDAQRRARAGVVSRQLTLR